MFLINMIHQLKSYKERLETIKKAKEAQADILKSVKKVMKFRNFLI
jgi:hypothetical protein